MKYFLLIADGMADEPLAALGGKTPLAAAKTPNMDLLAASGHLGQVRTIPEGCVPGSDSGILTLLGYDPRQYLTGRSALEAEGCGISLAQGQSACRCNLVTIQNHILVSRSAGDLDAAGTNKLLAMLLHDTAFSSLCRELNVRFYPLSAYRLLCIGPSELLEAAKTMPPHEIVGRSVEPYLPQGSPALLQLMALANRVLAEAQKNQLRKFLATDLWPWAPGKAMALPSFSQKFGKHGAMISATPLVLGIARLAGLSPVFPSEATGTLHTNYSAKAQAARNRFEIGDEMVCIHVEAPDDCSHNQDLQGKIQAVEAIDGQILGPVLSYLSNCGEAFRVLLLPDHRTLTATGCHDNAPVPWLLYDSTAKEGTELSYSEDSAQRIGNLICEGTRLISLFLA